MKKFTAVTAILAIIYFLSGCGDNRSAEAKMMNEKSLPEKVQKRVAEKPAAESSEESGNSSADLSGFYKVFNDSASIAPKDGKSMMIVFGQPADPYTQKLQKDVESERALADKIKSVVTPIYIDATAQKRHKFYHSGQLMDVDTKTLISIYHIESTPTIIFTDMNGSSIFIVPGYMPPRQFEVTLDFVKEGVWRGKDRKSGEVYQVLKSYYSSHGVKVGGAK